MDLSQRSEVNSHRRRFSKEVNSEAFAVEQGGHTLAFASDIGSPSRSPMKSTMDSTACPSRDLWGSPDLSLESGGCDLEGQLRQWRAEFERRKRSSDVEERLQPPRLFEAGRDKANTPRAGRLEIRPAPDLHVPREAGSPIRSPAGGLSTKTPFAWVMPDSEAGPASGADVSLISVQRGADTPRSTANLTGEFSNIANRREFCYSQNVLQLGVGEVGFLRDSSEAGAPEQGSAREFQSADPSVVLCRRVELTPAGFSGAALWEHQFLGVGPGRTSVSCGSVVKQICVAAANRSFRTEPTTLLPQALADDDALLRKLAKVRREVAERDQSLKELRRATETTREDELERRVAADAAECERLEREVAQADAQIGTLEEQLRRPSPVASTVSPLGAWGEETRSEASTALPNTGREAQFQEKAKTLEREIRSEAATALELQDRIHWLRNQLRRQPGSRSDGLESISDLMVKIQRVAKLDVKSMPCALGA